jgi:protein phosphatase
MAMLSDIGRVRLRNEDQVFCDAAGRVAALADGMGGHAGGALAAQLALAAWREAIAAHDINGLDEALLRHAVACANRAVFEASTRDPRLRHMGTTLVGVCFRPDGELLACHVGDSRLYRLRDDILSCLTRDHSVLRAQWDAGMIDCEAAGDPALRGLLTRAVGVEVEAVPDMLTASIQAGDVYLLCSDGLTEMLAEVDIADILASLGANPRVAAEHLVDLANERGGTDNVSVVIVSLLAEGRPTAVLA